MTVALPQFQLNEQSDQIRLEGDRDVLHLRNLLIKKEMTPYGLNVQYFDVHIARFNEEGVLPTRGVVLAPQAAAVIGRHQAAICQTLQSQGISPENLVLLLDPAVSKERQYRTCEIKNPLHPSGAFLRCQRDLKNLKISRDENLISPTINGKTILQALETIRSELTPRFDISEGEPLRAKSLDEETAEQPDSASEGAELADSDSEEPAIRHAPQTTERATSPVVTEIHEEGEARPAEKPAAASVPASAPTITEIGSDDEIELSHPAASPVKTAEGDSFHSVRTASSSIATASKPAAEGIAVAMSASSKPVRASGRIRWKNEIVDEIDAHSKTIQLFDETISFKDLKGYGRRPAALANLTLERARKAAHQLLEGKESASDTEAMEAWLLKLLEKTKHKHSVDSVLFWLIHYLDGKSDYSAKDRLRKHLKDKLKVYF